MERNQGTTNNLDLSDTPKVEYVFIRALNENFTEVKEIRLILSLTQRDTLEIHLHQYLQTWAISQQFFMAVSQPFAFHASAGHWPCLNDNTGTQQFCVAYTRPN